ncbi:MAG: ribonuclease J [Eubacteriales bacterium]|nr:ribonuclease J [Clostridiales bacterium]MDD7397404.1 ribonuclease J [Eubacteriales bacterium]MDY2981951.1 ribonuclease J [Eubacteriales bacterium]
MRKKKNAVMKLIPLGGMGEIGKNMTLLEYGEDILIIDCGIAFPDDDMPGIDVVIPDMTYLEENAQKIRGILITHGHEDHIGAVPYALKKFNVPVYGTDLSIALIEHKLEEMKVKQAQLHVVKPGDTVELGCFKAEFIKISHSIPGAVALAITTPFGVLLHTGDFKIDLTPLDGQPIDINRLAYYGSKGVLALMSDSTNVEKPGYTQSEREIGKTFEHYFDIAHGRMIVASFASNVWRLQQVADVAIRHGRVICFAGRSMEQIVAASQKLGYLNIPEDKIVKVDQLKKFNDDKVCIITTGSQGEPMSGLYRMANASHKVNVGKGDTVIISASAIPGNEKGVARVINNLFEKGAYVVYDRMADVHVSGHACREELKLMLHIIKPRYFIPAHGEQRHLMMHAQLAEDMGVPPENVFVVNIGETVSFSKNGAQRGGSVASGSVMVDGSDSIGNVVLNDRKQLADDGLLVAVMTIHKETGRQMAPTEIISRGFVYMKDSEELIHQAVESIQSEVERFEKEDKSSYANIKNSIKTKLKTFFKSKTKRTPVIVPIVIEVE